MSIDDGREQLEQELREKTAALASLKSSIDALETASIDAIAQFDANGLISGWNAQAQKLFGWSAEEIIGQPFEQTLITEQSRHFYEGLIGLVPHPDREDRSNNLFDIDAIHRDGHEFPIHLSTTLIANTVPEKFYACIRDVSERKLAETVIWNQANFDELTSLPNRNLFLHKLEQGMLENRRNETSMALLHIDLDRFKEINDGHGHSIGDLLLIEISNRLKNTVREVDTVSRVSGDEFTVILGNISEELAVQRICQDLLDSLAEPCQFEDEVLHLTASIGVTFFPQDAEDIEILQKNADQAKAAAKTAGRNRYHFFTSELQQQALRKRNIINQLRNAIDENQFEVYYQPIIDMSNGEINKAEALIRWHHPEKELVSPAVFIPLAEESGLINSIGDWVFHQTIDQVGHWNQQFDSKIQVSINTSALQWINEGSAMREWFPHLAELKSSGLSIAVEITEGLMMNANDAIINRLLEFHDADVQIAIDDFGTGYSSLSDLKQFEIDYLKIDQSFVRNMDSDADDRDLCEAIIVMAHKLGIQVIAEGVETESQRQLLQDFNCDFAQGFLYSKPVPAAEFEKLISSSLSPPKPRQTGKKKPG